MKTLLVIGYVWPEPKSSAAGSRMMQLLHFFKEEGFRIIFGTTAQKSSNAENLEAIGIEGINIQLNDESFDHLLKKMLPEIVIFDRFMMQEQFGWRVSKNCPDALQILDTEDLHFLRKAREENKRAGKEVDFYHSDIAKREIASIYRSDLSLIISEVEMEILQQQFGVPEKLLFYLPFMQPNISEEEIEKLPAFGERQDFMSIGNFKHAPNTDAILFLKKEIWPLIRQKLPKAKIHIFGAYVTQAMLQLHNEKEGFLIKGQAESAFKELQKRRALLAPLRFGAGLKGKFIDAMEAGTPTVTTSLGTEGMKKGKIWNGLIADESTDFAAKAIQLYTDEELWNQNQRNGFQILNELFSQEVHKNRFREKIQDLMETLEEQRKSNFTGAMLRHHSLNSTKYLSKYIETKNKLQGQKETKKNHP